MVSPFLLNKRDRECMLGHVCHIVKKAAKKLLPVPNQSLVENKCKIILEDFRFFIQVEIPSSFQQVGENDCAVP